MAGRPEAEAMSVTDPAPNPLAKLLENAKQLNEASNEVNRELKKLEDTLNAAKVGLTFWFESKPLHQSDTTGDLSSSEYTSVVLGYTRIGGNWCLAVKRLREVSGFFEGDTSCPFTNVFMDVEPEALLKTSRDLRLKALQLMPEFLTALNEHIESNIGAIRAATGRQVPGES
jgi:hypothetical protein